MSSAKEDLIMDITLLERIENLGQMGDLVTVKPGYARNYPAAAGQGTPCYC